MTTARWDRIKRIYHTAMERDEHERRDFVAHACEGDLELQREIDALLDAVAEDDPFLTPPPGRALPQFDSDSDASAGSETGADLIGRRIGAYRIEELLSSGGMGYVYLACRADETFEHKVAIKVLKRGIDSDRVLHRFQVERQALARLQHPHIAHLLDGGSTSDGRPYFVMEYVEGEPITAWCDREQLSTEQRLHLFRKVCHAVQHAHRNLILHCDLKPGNILVSTDGTPKLVDFGIARLLEPAGDAPLTQSAPWQRFMTAEYASPEYIRGDPLTTASDIYSLGVVLYQLLSGRLPHDLRRRSLPEIARTITEVEPERPSAAVRRTASAVSSHDTDPTAAQADLIASRRNTGASQLRRRLTGDLDTIVLKALRKEPAQRYASAEQLAEDIGRHLEGVPVMARAPTAWYRTSRFARRNRLAVSIASLALVLLIAGVVATSWAAAKAVRSQRNEQTARRHAEEVVQFLQDLLSSADPQRARGAELSVRELLEQATDRVGRDLKGQPAVEAEVRETLGATLTSLGLYDRAEVELNRALSLKRKLDASAIDVAPVLLKLSEVAYWQQQLDQAEVHARAALTLLDEDEPAHHDALAAACNNLAAILNRRGLFDEAEPLHQQALTLRRGIFGARSAEVAETLNNLATLANAQENYDEAERLVREARSIRRETLGEDHPLTIQASINLAVALAHQDKHEQAIALLREAIPAARRVFGEDHPHLAIMLARLGEVLYKYGRYAEAIAPLRESMKLFSQHFPADSRPAVQTHLSLAKSLIMLRRPREAEAELRQAFDAIEDVPDHPEREGILQELIKVYKAMDDRDQAGVFQQLLQNPPAHRE